MGTKDAEDDDDRRDLARDIYSRHVASQVNEPLVASDQSVGIPRFVEAFHPIDGNESFWRVPVVSQKFGRMVGFFDVRQLEEGGNNQPIRVSRLPRRPIEEEGQIVDLPLDTLEMSSEKATEQIQATFGADSTIECEPQLVFDKAETRVAWKVEVRRPGESFTALVTPGFAQRVDD